eukprot:TRINITY_DN87152_c0_g1_i1.p1 TRINITY_DN87152_c0_g1~~TRINITY_DN87152_c0_g1_i1.p1  ORF type:complete len:593 (+),score=47.16 TRINITY_DN87152_c0_g1_i1:118-1779(+)
MAISSTAALKEAKESRALAAARLESTTAPPPTDNANQQPSQTTTKKKEKKMIIIKKGSLTGIPLRQATGQSSASSSSGNAAGTNPEAGVDDDLPDFSTRAAVEKAQRKAPVGSDDGEAPATDPDGEPAPKKSKKLSKEAIEELKELLKAKEANLALEEFMSGSSRYTAASSPPQPTEPIEPTSGLRYAPAQPPRPGYDYAYIEGEGQYQSKEERECIDPAPTRCDSKTQAGWTRGWTQRGLAFCCVYFARGCCTKGQDCKYMHIIPGEKQEINTPYTLDVFGRKKFKTDHPLMMGVGNYQRDCKSLQVSGIDREATHIEPLDKIIWRHFSEWGELESLYAMYDKPYSYVTYKYRVSAEFAREAMMGQKLESNEVLLIKWADSPSRQELPAHPAMPNSVGAPEKEKEKKKAPKPKPPKVSSGDRWKPVTNDEGKTYWWNETTGVTQWEDPRDQIPTQPVAPKPKPKKKKAKTGWKECTDSAGRTYWWNRDTNLTQWHNPHQPVLDPGQDMQGRNFVVDPVTGAISYPDEYDSFMQSINEGQEKPNNEEAKPGPE